jgi:transposase
VQEVTGESVELAYADQGYTGDEAADAAETHGIRLQVVKHSEVKRGFVLLPRRWVVETTQPHCPYLIRTVQTVGAWCFSFCCSQR